MKNYFRRKIGEAFPFYKFQCPRCSNPLEFHSRLSGEKVRCPSCKKTIEVPPPENAGSRHTWGNWTKGIFLFTSLLFVLFIIGMIVFFVHSR